MRNHKTLSFKCKAPTGSTIEPLKRACLNPKEGRVVTILWENQGILTHDLSEKFGCKSNNHHHLTQRLNPQLIKLGWVITKYPSQHPSKSWRWYLEPVNEALEKPILASLRRKIEDCMEAANDE